jgi:hypothetical protein
VGVVSESPVKEKLYRRLERLEEEMIPTGPPHIFDVRFINPDGTEAPGGFQIEVPSYGPEPAHRMRRGLRGWFRSRYR